MSGGRFVLPLRETKHPSIQLVSWKLIDWAVSSLHASQSQCMDLGVCAETNDMRWVYICCMQGTVIQISLIIDRFGFVLGFPGKRCCILDSHVYHDQRLQITIGGRKRNSSTTTVDQYPGLHGGGVEFWDPEDVGIRSSFCYRCLSHQSWRCLQVLRWSKIFKILLFIIVFENTLYSPQSPEYSRQFKI